MNDRGSVTQWIESLRQGDSEAIARIWARYFDRLIDVARRRMLNSSKRVIDEDDIVSQAFDSFFRGAELDRFRQLADRHDLWQVLLMLVRRKAINLRVHQNRQKRGNGKVRGESYWGGRLAAESGELASNEPTPELAVELAEECERKLAQLGDPMLERVARLKLEGYSIGEIAKLISRKERTVQRKLGAIRELWLLDESVPMN